MRLNWGGGGVVGAGDKQGPAQQDKPSKVLIVIQPCTVQGDTPGAQQKLHTCFYFTNSKTSIDFFPPNLPVFLDGKHVELEFIGLG